MSNPHAQAITQLHQVAGLIAKEYADQKRFTKALTQLETPDRVLEGKISITKDDGTKAEYQAYRSQHNNARGPYKGGIRFHQNVSKEEVMALSTWMTWKCAVTHIPYGGGKGGIIVDPKTLSQTEQEQLCRSYSRFVAENVGPWTDVPAPDVNTNGQHMAWMVDEWTKWYEQQVPVVGVNPLATFTGKPLTMGGSQGRDEATGLGGVFVLEQLAQKRGWQPKQTTVAIQGFGNVGYWFAYHAAKRGYTVVAVSGSKGGVYNTKGLDPAKLLAAKESGKGWDSFGEAITNDALLALDVTVLVPAALENALHKDNASKVKAKTIIEMANGPVTPEADEILAEMGVDVVPDVMANAGGVTTSYFEWVQNLQGYYWPKPEVLAKLEGAMTTAFGLILDQQAKLDVSFRMATYSLAVKKVVDAMLIRR